MRHALALRLLRLAVWLERPPKMAPEPDGSARLAGYFETLDDYQTGEFTPSAASTLSNGKWVNAEGVGSYTKIGNLITYTLKVKPREAA